MRCDSPSLQDALLAEARAGALRSAVYIEHLALCDDCRDALGFLQRARQHQSSELSPDELVALRLRILPRLSRQPAAAVRRLPGLSLAFAIGASAAVTLASGSYFVWRGQAQQDAAPGRPAPSDPASRPAPKPAQVPQLAEMASEPVATEAPRVASDAPRAAPTGKPTSSAPKSAASGLWSDAASALKDDNLPRAEQALGQLVSDPDNVTRDSAQLALAEIWLKTNQVPRARTALGRLSRSGATPAIRQRASRLLAELPR